MEHENVIIFSSDDWASGLRTGEYHVATQLARSNRLLFVDSLDPRSPAASGGDMAPVFRRLSAFFRSPTGMPDGLLVCAPVVFSCAGDAILVRWLSNLMMRFTLQ